MKPAAEIAVECLRLVRGASYRQWDGDRPNALWLLFGVLPLLGEEHQDMLRAVIVAGARVKVSPTCVDGLGAVYDGLAQIIDELDAEIDAASRPGDADA